ncbi:MAG: hypothetical protein AB2L24_07860 [Mangrovibacterium sp.]
MKALFIILLSVTYTVLYCQTPDKFSYKYSTTNNLVVVEPKSEQRLSGIVKAAEVRFLDEKWLTNTVDSICRVAFSEEKRNLLSKVEKKFKGRVSIYYFPSGEVYQIKFYLPYESKEILTDDDLYSLYDNLMKYRMDMSKIELRYTDSNPDTKYIWTLSFPIYKERQ